MTDQDKSKEQGQGDVVQLNDYRPPRPPSVCRWEGPLDLTQEAQEAWKKIEKRIEARGERVSTTYATQLVYEAGIQALASNFDHTYPAARDAMRRAREARAQWTLATYQKRALPLCPHFIFVDHQHVMELTRWVVRGDQYLRGDKHLKHLWINSLVKEIFAEGMAARRAKMEGGN